MFVLICFCNEVGTYCLCYSKAFNRQKRFAAAGTAVAYKIYVLADVFAELYQVLSICLLKQVFALRDVNLPGMAVFYQGGCASVEGHADIHRGIARSSFVKSLVTAITHAYANV